MKGKCRKALRQGKTWHDKLELCKKNKYVLQFNRSRSVFLLYFIHFRHYSTNIWHLWVIIDLLVSAGLIILHLTLLTLLHIKTPFFCPCFTPSAACSTSRKWFCRSWLRCCHYLPEVFSGRLIFYPCATVAVILFQQVSNTFQIFVHNCGSELVVVQLHNATAPIRASLVLLRHDRALPLRSCLHSVLRVCGDWKLVLLVWGCKSIFLRGKFYILKLCGRKFKWLLGTNDFCFWWFRSDFMM